MTPRYILAAAIVLVLAGCTATPAVQPTPEPPASLATPDVPITTGRLTAPQPTQPPVSVEVPDVGISVSVTPVGIKPDGLMDIPENVAIAGWYAYGPGPLSDTGTTVIAAHVDSLQYGLGPFATLKSLGAGAQIIVTVASGAAVRYQVQTITNFPKAQLPVDEIFDREGDQRLALITCGGQFDYNTRTYSDNVVVIAVPVAS